MPIGEYKDFKSCVEANQDKDSPEGYCASIEKKITGEWPGVKKAEYNAEGRRKVEDHAKYIHGEIQRLLKEHGNIMTQHGDEFHNPGHLAKFHETMSGFKVPYSQKEARLAGGQIKTTTRSQNMEKSLEPGTINKAMSCASKKVKV